MIADIFVGDIISCWDIISLYLVMMNTGSSGSSAARVAFSQAVVIETTESILLFVSGLLIVPWIN
jgi:hypothetical protein